MSFNENDSLIDTRMNRHEKFHMPTKTKRNMTSGKVKWILKSKINILDEIKIDFKYTGFGEYPLSLWPLKGKDLNNFDVTIQYAGKSIKEAYAIGEIEFEDKQLDDEEKAILKIDILKRAVIDCFPPETFEDFVEQCDFEVYQDTIKFLEEIYDDIVAQAKKNRRLFDEKSIDLIKQALTEWKKDHPELCPEWFDEDLDEITRGDRKN